MSFYILILLNGLSYGLLLFLMSSGLTLIFSMMGVLNFAHASFYMLGAYGAYALGQHLSFGEALILAPLLVGLVGAMFEYVVLRRVHTNGHVAELMVTFGLSYIVLELVQLVWGRNAVDYVVPEKLSGVLFTWAGAPLTSYRVFIMVVSIAVLALLHGLLTYTRVGLVIQAARTQPDMVRALGHNLPRVYALVFGLGCALAALAGVLGGNLWVTEPAMAQSLGALLFVVLVVGGVGSLRGAFLTSITLGVLQTWAVSWDASLNTVLLWLGWLSPGEEYPAGGANFKLSQLASVVPYLAMVLVLVFRPQGLWGRESGSVWD